MTFGDVAALTGILSTATVVGGLLTAWLRGWRRRGLLEDIARHRERGVELRNRGQFKISTANEFAAWSKEWDIWRNEALGKLSAIARHESIAFKTIGNTLPEDHVGGDWKITNQAESVAFLTADLRRLEEIRRRYSPTA